MIEMLRNGIDLFKRMTFYLFGFVRACCAALNGPFYKTCLKYLFIMKLNGQTD